ncbi:MULTISPECIES: hypothetical protein [unclassified Streptomyces]|uniref:hypothetical protein n=1 Tax=Streptomyces sp. NBC_00490 TaxID=2903657 RepID=UPI002E16C886
MATDVWQEARNTLVSLWRRARPEQAEVIDTELVEARPQLLAARQAGDDDTEQVMVADWQIRLQSLMQANPAVAEELRALLDDRLTPALAQVEQTRVEALVMKAKASGSGRVYQAGRDQHITER